MSIFHSKEFCDLHGMTLYKNILPFGFTNNQWSSPVCGTFGGFLSGTVDEMKEALNEFDLDSPMGPQRICLAPSSHDHGLFCRSVDALSDYKVHYGDINYDIEIDGKPLATRMTGGHRKKLAKSERAGYEARQMDREEWVSAYALLHFDRQRKGLTLSMSFDQIMDQEEVLPGTTKVFGVFDGFTMISAAICMQIKPDVLYVWSWGDNCKSEFAPTIFLASYVYEYCQKNNIRILDIGIGTLHGVPNLGLMSFKESLGFQQSLKLTMVKI